MKFKELIPWIYGLAVIWLMFLIPVLFDIKDMGILVIPYLFTAVFIAAVGFIALSEIFWK